MSDASDFEKTAANPIFQYLKRKERDEVGTVFVYLPSPKMQIATVFIEVISKIFQARQVQY